MLLLMLTQSSNPQQSYCDFSIWPNDLERRVLCCPGLWDNFHQVWPTTYLCLNYSVSWLTWLTVDYLIAYKVFLTACHNCFHQKSTTLAYVLEVTVIHSPYVQINYVNPLLCVDAYFVFFDYQQCFLLLYLLFAALFCSNICFCHLF